jgi:hypothetical protein
MRVRVIALAVAALAAACSRPADTPTKPPPGRATAQASPPVATGFSHQPRFDAFGYYSPDREVTVGDRRFSVIAIGGGDQFDAWERGERQAAYAPVMIVFDQATAPARVGPDVPTDAGATRVMPDAYVVSDREIRFEGRDPKLGRVSFRGALDRKALAGAQADPSGSGVVLTGTLQIGRQRIENLNFTWFGGD